MKKFLLRNTSLWITVGWFIAVVILVTAMTSCNKRMMPGSVGSSVKTSCVDNKHKTHANKQRLKKETDLCYQW